MPILLIKVINIIQQNVDTLINCTNLKLREMLNEEHHISSDHYIPVD